VDLRDHLLFGAGRESANLGFMMLCRFAHLYNRGIFYLYR
jgi:hypothetical protein